MKWLVIFLAACSSDPPPAQTVVIKPAATPEAPKAPVNTFYKYKGERGVWSYADSLSMIPAKYRASAVQMDLPSAKPGEEAPPAPVAAPAAKTQEADKPAAKAQEADKPAAVVAQEEQEVARAKKADAKKDAEMQKKAEELLQKAKALEQQATERASHLSNE